MPAPFLKWCSAQSHVSSAWSPCSVLSLHPAKPYGLQGKVLLNSALQILVLPSYKPDGNNFTFLICSHHQAFSARISAVNHLWQQKKISLNRHETLRFSWSYHLLLFRTALDGVFKWKENFFMEKLCRELLYTEVGASHGRAKIR